MEKLLHYIWKNKLFQQVNLHTTTGESLEIIDVGTANTNAGPDFFNAKIKIDGVLWAGNIEIHVRSSDWVRHTHQNSGLYDNVVLHVIKLHDVPLIHAKNNNIIPQFIMQYPAAIEQNYEYLLQTDTFIPCAEHIKAIPAIIKTSWLSYLQMERLEQKTTHIGELLKQFNNDWEEVMYILLARCLGSGVNNDAFERLAKSLPLLILLKHADSLFQMEALLFGQAGLLENEENVNDYYLQLKKEYSFLRQKYNLKSLPLVSFKSHRLRPVNFPEVRIAQLATIYHKYRRLFSQIISIQKIDDLNKYLKVEPSAFWETHYNFTKESLPKKKTIGNSMINTIAINATIPMLFAYGKSKGKTDIIDKALNFSETLPSENNTIIREWEDAGIKAKNTADSQALIQLTREYCEKKKCLYCRIGREILAK